jgi:PPOX class probable F420-dependent enzyme
VDVEAARAFIRRHHRAILAARRSDGSVQMSPVLAGIDGEGRLEISSNDGRAKVVNVRRDPRVSVLVMTEKFFERRWIQVDGTADIVSLPEAMDMLVDYYRGISGEHPDWDDYRRAMEQDERVMVRVTMERAGPDRHR